MAGRWRVGTQDPAEVRRVARRHGLPELVAGVLLARGHADEEAAERHLRASAMELHDPFLLPGMEAATDRLAHAVRNGERILVHGDYDVDGVTGTTLLMRLFALVGGRAVWHIPNRLVDGYSFGPHSIERARAEEARVVVSVDNGTTAHEVIADLAALGIDTVVTDHHEALPGPLPDARAIVNPKLPGSTYPWPELCGGAVAFKLAWGLARELSGAQRVTPELRGFLEDATALVAIATVCDVVPLLDENRILARLGLAAMERTRQVGLRALLASAGLGGRRPTAEDVAFQIGPRINASGRLGSAEAAVELLLTSDVERARRLAGRIEELNQRRKEIELEVTRAALEAARAQEDPERHPVLVLAGEGWHQGVVGIVAARLVERFHRPAIVIGLDGDEGRGSARSVAGFSVLEAMHGAAAHFVRYGGHEQAAGCEVRAEAVDRVREAVCARARELLGEAPYPEPELLIDVELPLPGLTPEVMHQLDRLAPFGVRNEKPVLLSRGVFLAEVPREVGSDGSHLLLRLRHGATAFKAMAFGMADRLPELRLGVPIDAVYTPRWNTFRGETKLELELHDFRRALA